MCLDVVNFDGLTVGNSGGTSTEGTGTPEAAASEAQLVPEKTKKVFVVINPYTDGNKGWNLTADAVKGKPWSAINTAIEAVIANIATNDNFMMASVGEGAGIEGALMGVKGISFVELNKKDIVRHKLVERIVEIGRAHV